MTRGDRSATLHSASIRGLIVLAMVAACSGSERGVKEVDVERAQTALLPFKSELKSTLLEGLESGPVAAIAVCREAAPEIALHHSTNGIEMGRTSHRLRNPGNGPADWMNPLLESYVKGSREPYRAVVLDDRRVGYVEPIYLQKPCLMCHGETVAPVIVGQIEQLYPGDLAVGFEEGDFRGLFWVTIPIEDEEQ
jgi:hypothetical protein